MATENHIAVEAPRSQLIGTTAIVGGWPVVYVSAADAPKIKHQKYTQDYTRASTRPWKVGGRGYGSLANALRALALIA